MKSRLLVLTLLAVILKFNAQELAVGTSYFLPVNAPLSVAVPPVVLRGELIGDENWALETGITWYRMSGMALQSLSFPMLESALLPFNSFVFPLQIGGKWRYKSIRIQPKIGVFASINSQYKLHEDALSRAYLRSRLDLSQMQTNSRIEQSNTFGLLAGVFLGLPLKKEWMLKIGGSWYEGQSPAAVSGSFQGLSQNQVPVTGNFNFNNSTLDFRGFEMYLGIEFKWE